MAITNNRVRVPQAVSINGIDAGGVMTARIQAGYDGLYQSAPDGLQVALKDKEIEFVRGSIVSQDWAQFISLLTGALGTLVFYERRSGVAEATGYIKHTIVNPVIHRAVLAITKGQYATVSFDFECKAADETKGIDDAWTMTDAQTPPTYIAAARGGYRITAAQFDSGGTPATDLYHLTRFDFTLELPLLRECNDTDIGYTCVEARLDGLKATGSITLQDGAISTGPPALLLAQQLLTHAKSDLVLTITQGQGASAKTVTILGVDFNDIANESDSGADFTGYTVNFEIANDPTTQLTLAGDNKILAIA